MSKKFFFVTILGVLILFITSYKMFVSHADYQNLREFDDVRSAYGINVCCNNFDTLLVKDRGKIYFEKPESKFVTTYKVMFKTEISKYTKNIIKKAKIFRIVLCKNLKLNDRPASAIAGYDHNTIYVDICLGADNEYYQSYKLHHEIFHMIDYADDMQIETDNNWESLNTKGFLYEPIGTRFLASETNFPSRMKGFLTNYSTTALEEDKADIYAYMITNKEFVRKKSESDKIIKRKIDYINKLLNKFSDDFGKFVD